MALFEKVKLFKMREIWFPLLLFGAAVCAYGLMIGELGFYWDDWEILFLSSAAQTPNQVFLYPFRPLHVILDIATVRLLGFNPLYWHLLMLTIRYLTALTFWKLLKIVWPEHPARNAWTALMFLVYPAFLHQSMSVVYRQHFTTALLYLLSVWWMMKSIQAWQRNAKRQYWFLLGASLMVGTAHLFVTEYFAAMELWRPLILFVFFLREKPGWIRALKQATAFWLPYLVYTIGYVFWRLRIVQPAIDDPNQTVLLDELRSKPISALLTWVSSAPLDIRYVLLGSWFDTLSPEFFNLRFPVSLIVLMLVAGIIVVLIWLMHRYSEQIESRQLEAVFIGFMGMIFGLMPAWLIGRSVYSGRYDTRFTIPALAGVSLLVVSLIFWLISDRKKITVLLAVVTAMAIGRQVHMANVFRWDWERQVRTYWQVYLRAPKIEPGTAVLVNRSVSSYATTYPIGYALNFLYYPNELNMSPNLWWFEVYDSRLAFHVDDLQSGGSISTRFHQLQFETEPYNSLVFNLPFADESPRCVWLLSPADSNNALISFEMQEMTEFSNLSRLGLEGPLPQKAIFGSEPGASWCTLYQQAELAAQYQDWDTVNSLYLKVLEGDFNSPYGHEYLPYLSGSVALGKWSQAAEISLKAHTFTESLKPVLCSVWEQFSDQANTQYGYQTAYERVNAELSCREE